MSVAEYWTGRDLDIEALWKDFDGGRDYEVKVSEAKLALLRLTFSGHPMHLPLFDHEVISKTIKGTFHDVKRECFSTTTYNKLVPMFIYRIDRGSGIFEFLAELQPVVTLVVALGAASMWYRSALTQDQDLDEKRLNFLRDHFPGATAEDTSAYIKAWSTFGRRRVLHRLLALGLHRVEVSAGQLNPSAKIPATMINVETIVVLQGREGTPNNRLERSRDE